MKKDQKKDLISQHQRSKKDTGSHEVQIALLTHKIIGLTDHLKTHPKDVHSRRGLIGMVSRRRKMVKSLRQNDPIRCKAICEKFSLKMAA